MTDHITAAALARLLKTFFGQTHMQAGNDIGVGSWEALMNIYYDPLKRATLWPITPREDRVGATHFRIFPVGSALDDRSLLICDSPVKIERNLMRRKIVYFDLIIIIQVCRK